MKAGLHAHEREAPRTTEHQALLHDVLRGLKDPGAPIEPLFAEASQQFCDVAELADSPAPAWVPMRCIARCHALTRIS